MTLETRYIFHTFLNNNLIDMYFDYLKKRIAREDLIKIYREQFEPIPVINLEINENNVASTINMIEKKMSSVNRKKVNVIIGGPPCQAYSIIGRSRMGKKVETDPRNELFHLYFRFVNHFKPDVFVFENVPGMLSVKNGRIWKNFIDLSNKYGYSTHAKIYDSSDFGVLQKRKRIIVIGWKNELKYTFKEFKKINPKAIVFDILNDLPLLISDENLEVKKYVSIPSSYLINSGIRRENDIITLHEYRKNNPYVKKIYEIAIKKWNEEHKRLHYSDLPLELRTHRKVDVFKDRYRVVAGELPYSQTITAHISKDGNYYIHPDIKQLRSLSVREAARIQSFPDNYYFEGPKTSQYSQIGNAVPVLMSYEIARKVLEILEGR